MVVCSKINVICEAKWGTSCFNVRIIITIIVSAIIIAAIRIETIIIIVEIRIQTIIVTTTTIIVEIGIQMVGILIIITIMVITNKSLQELVTIVKSTGTNGKNAIID